MTCEHLSELEGRLSFCECTTEAKDALVGMRATNDVAESSIFVFHRATYFYVVLVLEQKIIFEIRVPRSHFMETSRIGCYRTPIFFKLHI